MERVEITPGLPIGCLIDASHFSADYLNQRIINFAQSFGLALPDDDSVEQLFSDDSDLNDEQSERLLELSDSAVGWLNENCAREGYAFNIDNNSLYFEPIGE